MKRIIPLVSVALTLSALAAQSRAAETDLPFAKLPMPVRGAMKNLVGQGRMIKTTRETEKDGRVLYEVAYEKAGKKFEAEVSPAGEVIVVDEQITLADAPTAVRKAIEMATVDARIIKIEKATQAREIFYEAEFTKGNAEHEIKVAADGKVISAE